jgi:hypothetical protein
MYRVIAGDNRAGFHGTSDGMAYGEYVRLCKESRHDINSDIYGCDVALYHDDYCVRQMAGHIQEPYNLPHSD